MDVAIDCFAKYGSQATSIDRIAKAAGVTKGALYYHFKDKEELLFEAVKKRVGQFERRVVGDLPPTADAAGALRQLARVCYDHATKSNHRRLIVTLDDRGARHQPAPGGAVPRHDAPLPRVSARHRAPRPADAASCAPTSTPAIAAEVYAGAIMGAEIQYYQDPKGFDLAATLDAFVDQYVGWLSAPAPNGARRNGHARPPRKEEIGMVSFEPSEDQQLIRDTVAAFAQRAGATAGT